MRRLFRFLAMLVVLVGLTPCELREAMPLLGGVVAGCCADAAGADAAGADAEGAVDQGDSTDCCDATACLCVVRVTAPMSIEAACPDLAYLLVDEPGSVVRLTSRSGPPPTPPPIA